jgi:hypothetical protein
VQSPHYQAWTSEVLPRHNCVSIFSFDEAMAVSLADFVSFFFLVPRPEHEVHEVGHDFSCPRFCE